MAKTEERGKQKTVEGKEEQNKETLGYCQS